MTVTADQILRVQNAVRNYKLEFAFGDNYCFTQDSTGAHLASATASASLSGYPVANLISGSTVHLNPKLDLDNNWWSVTYTGTDYAKVNLGQTISGNNLKIFLHPFLPTCSAYTVQLSPDDITYTTVATVTGANQLQVQEIMFAQTSYRYIKFIPNNGGVDGIARVVQIQAFNWVDVTKYIDTKNGQPNITITAKANNNQDASPTPSNMTVTMNNITKVFSNLNNASPYYGSLQVDGRGSGIRSNVPVRVTCSATAPQIDTIVIDNALDIVQDNSDETVTIGDIDSGNFSSYCFQGFISCDDNPAGSTGITYNDASGTVTFLCKSLYDLLATNISVPAYTGWFMHLIIKDICYRCGIPEQYLNITPIFQMAPYVAFDTGLATTMISQILQALPFTRMYESFDTMALTVTNYGRSKISGDLSLWDRSGNDQIYSYAVDKLLNFLYFMTSNGDLFAWNMDKPFETGIAMLGSGYSVGGNFLNSMDVITSSAGGGAYTHVILINDNPTNTTAKIHRVIASQTAGVFTVTTNDTITFTLASGDKIQTISCNSSDAFFLTANGDIYVWYPFIPSDYQKISSIPGSGSLRGYYPANRIFKATENFVFFDYNQSGDPAGFFLIYHGGTPFGTFTPVKILANNQNGNTNSWIDFITEQIYFLLPDVSNFFFAYQLGALAAFNSAGSLAPTSLGTTGVASDALGPITFCETNKYIFFSTSDSSTYIFNTITQKPAFKINSGSQYANTENGLAHLTFYKYSFNILPSLYNYNGSQFPLFFAFRNLGFGTGPTSGFLDGYWFNGITPFDTTPSVSFTLDNVPGTFLKDMNISDGNPECNRVQIFLNPNILNNTLTVVFNQPANYVFSFPPNQKTTVLVPLGSPSIRGQNSSGFYNRFCLINSVQVPDQPGAITTVTLNGSNYPITFIGYSDTAYLTIDTTGLPGLSLSGIQVKAYPLSSQTQYLAADVTDQPSKDLCGGREFLLVLQTALFNDPTETSDLLLNGKFAKFFISQMSMPWYPIIKLGEFVSVNNPSKSLVNGLFEVQQYTIQGFSTKCQLKQYYPTFNI